MHGKSLKSELQWCFSILQWGFCSPIAAIHPFSLNGKINQWENNTIFLYTYSVGLSLINTALLFLLFIK